MRRRGEEGVYEKERRRGRMSKRGGEERGYKKFGRRGRRGEEGVYEKERMRGRMSKRVGEEGRAREEERKSCLKRRGGGEGLYEKERRGRGL